MSTQSILLRDTTTLVSLRGEYPVGPIIRIKPTAQRSAPLAQAGWKWRRRYTIQNNASESLMNFPFALDLGLTNGLVTSKALANGNDLRIWHNGREIARTLVDWNDAADTTLAWIRIPSLKPGESSLYDVVYGNALAGAPPLLAAGSDKPIFDIATPNTATRSNNSVWRYKVQRIAANAGLGLWYVSSGTLQPDYHFNSPGSWQPESTNSAVDDQVQEPYSWFIDASVTYYHGRLQARRAIGGSTVAVGALGGDAVMIHVPTGIQSIHYDLNFRNMAIATGSTEPIGKVVLLGRRAMGQDWFKIYEDGTLTDPSAVLAAATRPVPAGTKDIAIAVWPFDDSLVNLSARSDRYAEVSTHTVLNLNLDSSLVTQTLTEAETEIYEIADRVSYGGGGSSPLVGEYQAIELGNFDLADGVDTPRAAVKINEQVEIDNEHRTVQVWNSDLTAKVEDFPILAANPVQSVFRGTSLSDPVQTDFVEQPDPDWLFVTPIIEPISNPDFTDNALGWTRGTMTSGLNAGAISRGTASPENAVSPGYGQVTIGVNSVTNGTVEDIASEYIPVGGRKSVWFGMFINTNSVVIQPTPAFWFYNLDINGDPVLLGSRVLMTDWTIPAANTWYRRVLAALVPALAEYYRVGTVGKQKGSGVNGTYKWDTVRVNGPEIVVQDVNPNVGTLNVTHKVRERFAYA